MLIKAKIEGRIATLEWMKEHGIGDILRVSRQTFYNVCKQNTRHYEPMKLFAISKKDTSVRGQKVESGKPFEVNLRDFAQFSRMPMDFTVIDSVEDYIEYIDKSGNVKKMFESHNEEESIPKIEEDNGCKFPTDKKEPSVEEDSKEDEEKKKEAKVEKDISKKGKSKKGKK